MASLCPFSLRRKQVGKGFGIEQNSDTSFSTEHEGHHQELIDIPCPPPLPIVGNLFDVDISDTLKSMIKHANTYGELYSMQFGDARELIVCSHAIAHELFDETRFVKQVSGGLEKLRPVGGNGLFTAQHDNHEWEIAHRVLAPAFGPLKIRQMFDDMKDVADQLCLKWARLGPGAVIDIVRDFTHLTLDTIALSSMGYRFNSFYRGDRVHPYIDSMGRVLVDADKQSCIPDFAQELRPMAMRRFRKDVRKLHDTCQGIIQQRRDSPDMGNDLLSAMLTGRDPKSGQGLSDDNIIHNLNTFLIAGHETTAGMLGFALCYLLEHPEYLHKAQAEVDGVVGHGPLLVEHLDKMPYMDAILRETLRLQPTAPGFYVRSLKDEETIAGKYRVKGTDNLLILLHCLHRDPAVWGNDAEEFRPERCLQENMDKLPSDCWKPFGNGIRSCLGRSLVWQEAKLMLAMMFQNFEFQKADPSYRLQIHQSLTIKPKNFNVRIGLRHGKNASDFYRGLHTQTKPSGTPPSSKSSATAGAGDTQKGVSSGHPMTILYGSNNGTCEALARRVALAAGDWGFQATLVAAMNEAKQDLPTDRPVVILTASYNGRSADNAEDFVDWLATLSATSLNGVEYAVFGCGHRDWRQSYMKIPLDVDRSLSLAGATRLASLAQIDTAACDLFSELDAWMEDSLWSRLASRYGVEPPIRPQRAPNGAGVVPDTHVDIIQPSRDSPREGYSKAIVTDSRSLSQGNVAAKRHLVLQLPPQLHHYQVGDRLQVLPHNSSSVVKRALDRFQLSPDSLIAVTCSRPLDFPTDRPIAASDLFGAHLELLQPANSRNLQLLDEYINDAEVREAIQSKIKARPYPSILELLEQFPSVDLPLSAFIFMVPAIRPRTYSISSAPSTEPGHGTLTYSVVPNGVASAYLASLDRGQRIDVALTPAPRDIANLDLSRSTRPLILVAMGAGLAPFRGFIEARAHVLQAGQSSSPAATTPACLLFFGCRGSKLDDLYREELDTYERSGVVKVHRAYSREAGAAHRYSTDSIVAARHEIGALWAQNAVVCVCGGKKAADSVFEVLAPILFEADRAGDGFPEAITNIAAWSDALPKDRYITEIYT